MEQTKYDVFISYSRKDTEIADKIVKAFENVGISCFIDRHGIGGGMEFPAVLAKAIKASEIFLFLASKNSYSSKFTQNEIVFAFNKKDKQTIIPYIIDDSTMPEEFEFTFSAINWRRMDQHPIESVLVDDILGKLGRTRPETVVQQSEKPKSQSDNRPRTLWQSFKSMLSDGLVIARTICGLSVLLLMIISFMSEDTIKNHYSGLENLTIASFWLMFLVMLLGYISPKLLRLHTRKEITLYYLVTDFLLFVSVCIVVSYNPAGA